jgi:hypothetical protein
LTYRGVREVVEKMKQQNGKLKKEFAELKQKLEEYIEKAKRGNRPAAGAKPEPSEEEMSKRAKCDLSAGAGNQGDGTEGRILQEADCGDEAAARRLF